MNSALMGLRACALALLSAGLWAQAPAAAAPPCVPCSTPSGSTLPAPGSADALPPAPRVKALVGELEVNRIIEVDVDHLADWNRATGGPAATRPGPASVHPAWQLVPYLNGRAIAGVTPLAVDLGQGRLQFHLRINEANRDTWTHLLSPLALERAVGFSVGLEHVDPFETDLTLESRRAQLVVLEWRWQIAAVLIVSTLCFAFFALAIHTTLLMELCKTPSGALVHRFSLAKVQLALWFFVVFGAFLIIWLVTGNFDTLNSSVLSTLSISAATALGDTFVKASGPTTTPAGVQVDRTETFRAPRSTLKRFMRELLSDDEECSIARFQMLAWTLVLVIVFLTDVLDDLHMPVFGPELLYLLGLSTGTYVAHRVPEMQRDRQRTGAAGLSAVTPITPAAPTPPTTSASPVSQA